MSQPAQPPAVGRASSAQQATTRLLAAKVLAQARWPYVSTLLFTLRPVEVGHEQVPTMAVDDGWRLYYSAAFVMSCTPSALATVVLHECQHLMLQHAARFAALNQPAARHRLWNFAGDAVINATLDEEGMPWPADRGIRYADLVRHGVAVGMATEAAFHALVRSGAEARASGPDPVARLAGPDCGSGSGGPRRTYERMVDDDDSPAVPRAQQDLVRDRVAQEVLAHARSRGDVPGSLIRWAQELLDPVVDWRTVLAGQIRGGVASVAGRRDYSLSYPSRRAHALQHSLGGAVLPAMRQPPPPRVSVVLDTSGSITQPNLRAFLGETVGIVRAVGLGAGVTVIPCDAQPGEPRRIRTAVQAAALPLPGGGGTDMGAGIAAAAGLRPRPDVIVVLTDGWTDWPQHPPGHCTAVITAITDPDAPHPPDWAQRISIQVRGADGSGPVLGKVEAVP